MKKLYDINYWGFFRFNNQILIKACYQNCNYGGDIYYDCVNISNLKHECIKGNEDVEPVHIIDVSEIYEEFSNSYTLQYYTEEKQ